MRAPAKASPNQAPASSAWSVARVWPATGPVPFVVRFTVVGRTLRTRPSRLQGPGWGTLYQTRGTKYLITSTPPDAKVSIYRLTSAKASAPIDPDASGTEERQKRVLYTQTSTPSTVSLERDNHYAVVFQKEGYDTKQQSLASAVDGWIAGNIIFGGLIGLVVDFANGAAYHLSPTPVDAILEAHQDSPPAPVISSVPSVPNEPQHISASSPITSAAVPARTLVRTPASAPTPIAVVSTPAKPRAAVPLARAEGVCLQPQYDRYQLFLQPRVDAKRLSRVSAGVWLKVIEARPQWLYVETPDEWRG